ncbi:MAG: sugar transferase [Gammaproteobacteria bacterium]|nr:sugar transferase [Gammaproteobacteria bacterium]MDP2140727.1 sugar transferase [Gammaproteobacteria bacterium]MDP2346981.1 sugar transferase [Gammaproteobacteria bacterium]
MRNSLLEDPRKGPKNRVLILGTGMFAIALANEILARPRCGLNIIGLVAEREQTGVHTIKFPLLGEINQLQRIILEHKPDRIIVTLDDRAMAHHCHSLVEEKFFRQIQVDDGEEVYENLTGKLAIDTLSQRSLMYSKDFQLPAHSLYLSRLLSVLFALTGLVLMAPLMVLIAIVIKLDSPGPVLFIQKRVGMGNRTFNLLKFRTMLTAQEKTSEWACDNDARITRSGRILRKFRLDELPQFINVLRNDMNVVGPRPHPVSNYELYALVSRNTPESGEQIPYYYLRCLVRPGITGWAQVKYRYANNLGEEIEKLRFDLYYIKHYSLWLDARILLETIKVVVMGHEHRY